MRTGVVTKKLGMSIFFDEQGKTIPVTLLKLDDCQVVGQRNNEKDGVTAVRIGYGKIKANKVTKPLKGYLKKQKVDFKKNIADFKVSQDALLDVGTYINANHYVVGQFIDATGISKGKGFAGAMKRYGFSGLRASHGVSISHRAHGSTGHCQDPGKVFKGKKMAGHMGDARVTKSNLEIIQIDEENNILIVKGAVPGSKNSYVLVKDAKKRGLPADVPYPGIKIVHEENSKDDKTADDSKSDVNNVDGETSKLDEVPQAKPEKKESGEEKVSKEKQTDSVEKNEADKKSKLDEVQQAKAEDKRSGQEKVLNEKQADSVEESKADKKPKS